ncbi:hypothetical protein [uncultured Imperialibacter sp.]|uniref:hypothetical protein n=1 Tax=uncultured Imperialibacter sp. TaxID=1672639 RepID=UPI0030D8F1B2|tara:strand:- start:814 stop:1008 length:195 start_codon:yes stop_codon:yes gene_type:complete
MPSANIVPYSAQVAGGYAEHGCQVLQGDLLQPVGFQPEHFFIPLLSRKNNEVEASGINTTNGCL